MAHLGKWEGLGVEGGEWVFLMSLLVNLKHKSRNLQ